VFLLETVDAGAFGETLHAATQSLAGLVRDRSRAVTVHQLAAADPAVGALAPGPGPDPA
jgi:hypothetical protein